MTVDKPHSVKSECPRHMWHKPTEGVVECLLCGLDADEFILGLRVDEATDGR